MKKKLILIPILVLALIASMGMPVVASSSSTVTLASEGDGTAEWTDEQIKFGNHSAKLTMPAGTGWVNDNAEARVAISGVLKLSDVTGWSFWAKGLDAYYVPIEFYIDIDGDGTVDKIIVGQKMGSMTSEWVELNQANMSMYMTWKNGYEWLWNWSEVQSKYGDATLLRVDIGYGSLGSNEAVTAYIDDFTLNNTTYAFEPPPEADRPEKDPNRFTVLMPFGRDGAKYVDKGDNTLRSGIEVTGIYDGVGYQLVIPEGCVIERLSGKRLNCLFLKNIEGSVLTFTTGKDDVEFSEPCVLYRAKGELTYNMWGKLVTDSEWVEVGSFTSIVDREAHLD